MHLLMGMVVLIALLVHNQCRSKEVRIVRVLSVEVVVLTGTVVDNHSHKSFLITLKENFLPPFYPRENNLSKE